MSVYVPPQQYNLQECTVKDEGATVFCYVKEETPGQLTSSTLDMWIEASASATPGTYPVTTSALNPATAPSLKIDIQ